MGEMTPGVMYLCSLVYIVRKRDEGGVWYAPFEHVWTDV